jgi:hypothetical protein
MSSVPASEPANSGKAVASMVLGLIPIPLLTGIPAIILGIWALFDIKRHAGQLRGSGLAICGIFCGGACTFLCTPLITGAVWFGIRVAQESNVSDDPEQVKAIASTIAQFELPEGLQPKGGLDVAFFGLKMVAYSDDSPQPGTVLMLMKFPAVMANNRQQMDQQMRQQMRTQSMGIVTEETQLLTYTVRGEPTTVTLAIGKNSGTGKRSRQYSALIPFETGPIMIMIITEDPPPESEPPAPDEPQRLSLSEEQVRQFFESFQ